MDLATDTTSVWAWYQDHEKLKKKGDKSHSVSLFPTDRSLSKALAEAKQEVSTLQMELEACVAENDQVGQILCSVPADWRQHACARWVIVETLDICMPQC